MKTKQVFGCELKVGDTIEVWWKPKRDTIVALKPYMGTYQNEKEWKGVRIAEFGINQTGMTIFPHNVFHKIVI